MRSTSRSRPALTYTLFPTSFGWMAAVRSDRGITRIALPMPSRRASLAWVGLDPEEAAEDAAPFGGFPLRMQRYFNGEAVTFRDALDLTGATAFQRAVWDATRLIPHGEVRSYAWLAEQVGSPRATRAVGQALARNPFPIVVPCHRIVAADGALGGFSSGLDLKRRLLELERATPRRTRANTGRRHSGCAERSS